MGVDVVGAGAVEALGGFHWPSFLGTWGAGAGVAAVVDDFSNWAIRSRSESGFGGGSDMVCVSASLGRWVRANGLAETHAQQIEVTSYEPAKTVFSIE